jgi:hypothetical protein
VHQSRGFEDKELRMQETQIMELENLIGQMEGEKEKLQQQRPPSAKLPPIDDKEEEAKEGENFNN